MAIGKPVYWKLSLAKESEKTFIAITKSLYIGQFLLPNDKIDQYLPFIGTSINNIFKKIINFKMIDFHYNKEGMTFTGILPTKIAVKP